MAFNSNNNNNGTNVNNSEDSENGKKKDLIIKVEKGSHDLLNELFDSALKGSIKTPLQVPYRMKKLPDSFFKPPSSGTKSPSVSVSHSRENSADSAFGSGTTILGGITTNGLPIHHSRAQSSPASLGVINMAMGLNPSTSTNPPSTSNTTKLNIGSNINKNTANPLTSTPSKAFQNIHSRGRSYDVTNLHQHQFVDLPPGWEQAKTQDGRIYYINHNARTTQWEDPRIQITSNPQNSIFETTSSGETLFNPTISPPAGPAPSTINPTGIKLNVNSNYTLGPLPDGWEEGITNNGERYYINHQTRTTTWRDPRISNHDWAAHEQQLRLHNLQMERERLRRRAQEINVVINKSHVGEDPFLPANLDTHTRQESGDSGLSLSSSISQSVSHTPDFLSNIDDSMDGLSVADNSMDTITFTEGIEQPDEFMLNDPLLLEKLDADTLDTLIDSSNKNGNTVYQI